MSAPVPGFPIFLDNARRRRRNKSKILPIDATDAQVRRAARRRRRK